jgi:hypothetical protein
MGDQAETELCRIMPQGGKSCVKVGSTPNALLEVRHRADTDQVFLQSASLFKSMQSLSKCLNYPSPGGRYMPVRHLRGDHLHGAADM